MKYVITEEDKSSILQGEISYSYRIYVLDESEKIIDTIKDFQISNPVIDGDSKVRRTFSLTVYQKNNIVQYINSHLRFKFKLQMGVYSFRRNDYIWYDFGIFVPIDTGTSYDMANNTVTFSMADKYAILNGTRNGQIGGAQNIIIPNQDENGNFVEIKSALINFIKTEGINNCIVEDIGEFYGIQSNNPDGYYEYRINNPLWNKMPYDLEFNSGCVASDIESEIVDLYPNTQSYFDIYGNYCAGMIPSCNHNPIELDNDYIQKIIVGDNSENVTYDVQAIHNVTEVFGKIYDVDRFSETCTINLNVYNVSLDNFVAYKRYEYIAFIPNGTNVSSMNLKINSLNTIPIYKEYTTEYISPNIIVANDMCVVRIMTDSNNNYVAYYLGKYQPHALCVLTNNINDTVYTKYYFSTKYNCKNVVLREEKDSPFTIQKYGEVLDVKSGNEYENIISDSVAEENAIYQNQKSSSMNETIEIVTIMLPWIDVQCKVSYKKAQDDEVCEYIIKSVRHNTDNNTSSITLRKFYPLYYK